MVIVSSLIGTTIDCPEPRKLAAFYQALTGWQLTSDSDDGAALSPSDGVPGIIFQRVENYRAPNWPEQSVPQQFHLDFYTDEDLDTAEAGALALGATRAQFQPDADGWRVMLDPAGHTFCLCPRSTAE